jgi:UDP-N-acetyl-D-mannosaminuronic acid dehydrogenase
MAAWLSSLNWGEGLRIAVVGMGYVGVPLAAVLADVPGFDVVGVQRRSERSGWKIDLLNKGVSPYRLEPKLGELLSRAVSGGSLHVTDSFDACGDADCVVITVQVPIDEERLGNLRRISAEVGSRLRRGALVSLESTVPPGTTEGVAKPALEDASRMKAGEGFSLVYSYERVTPGRLVHNIRHLPRVVGGYTPGCTSRGVEFYRNICLAGVHPTDMATAEAAKLIENTYKDVNIAFANETALICSSLGIDFHRVRELVNGLPHVEGEPRLNPFRNVHFPGAGVGGHCLPKDPWLLLHGYEAKGFEPRLIPAARTVNDAMPGQMKSLVVDALGEQGVSLREAKIILLGLGFKGDTEDARNSPTLTLHDLLRHEAGDVAVHDPYINRWEEVPLIHDLGEAVEDRDCLVVTTRHSVYREIDLGWLRDKMNKPIIVDGRDLFDPEECRVEGFTYRGIGHAAR